LDYGGLKTTLGSRAFCEAKSCEQSEQPFMASEDVTLILGVEYSLSWSFIFAIAIWLALFLFLIYPMDEITNNNFLGILASAVVVSIIGTTGIIKNAVDIISTAVNNT